MKKTTCGPLYKETRDRWAGDDEALIKAFTGGWVGGQAEKVYLGACQAAMFRPSKDRMTMLLTVVDNVAQRYGLRYKVQSGEIWIWRDQRAMDNIDEMFGREKDSPGWHRLRAILCGVPASEIDEKFHERKGAGERCD